jgi:hypothetical protein
MTTNDADDDLVPFQDVRVLKSALTALLCRIGDKNVWLPRGHIAGKLWCTGDRGKLFIRRWVARERSLIDVGGAIASSLLRPRLPNHLHLVGAIGKGPIANHRQ